MSKRLMSQGVPGMQLQSPGGIESEPHGSMTAMQAHQAASKKSFRIRGAAERDNLKLL